MNAMTILPPGYTRIPYLFKANIGIVWFLAAIVAETVQSENVHVKIDEKHILWKERQTQLQAANTCEGYDDGDGAKWTLSPSFEVAHNKSLAGLIRNHTSAPLSLWLPLRKVTFQSLASVDNSSSQFEGKNAPERGDMDSSAQDRTCGGYDPRSKELAYVPCTAGNSPSAFVCQVKDCSSCPLGTWPSKCVLEGNSCFLFDCHAPSWYYARATCRRQGGDLAVPSQDFRDMLSRALKSFIKPCSDNIWVGVRKVDWQLESTTKNAAYYPEVVLWDAYEPHYKGECALIAPTALDKSGATDLWKTAECSEMHYFVCSKDREIEETVPGTPPTVLPDHNCPLQARTASMALNSVGAGLLAFLIILFVIIVILAAIIVMQRERIREMAATEDDKGTSIFPKAWRRTISRNKEATESDRLQPQ